VDYVEIEPKPGQSDFQAVSLGFQVRANVHIRLTVI
jgi:hypothetical protein